MDLEFFIECFGEGIIWILTTIVGAIVAIFNRKEIRRRFAPIDYADKKVKRKNEYTRSPIVEEQVIKRIKEKDINFDENSFKIWVENLFIAFRNACSNKNMNEVRGYLDSNLFEQYQLLMNANNEAGTKNKIEVERVNYVDFCAYLEDNEKEILEMAINVVESNYGIEESTNKVINESNKIKQRTTYKMKFMRKTGTITRKNECLNCPNCGARVREDTKLCEYCKGLILNQAEEWLLNNIEKY